MSAKQDNLSNKHNSSVDSLPFQAPPSNCSFLAACPRYHHWHHHFSGCNQSTGKGKGRRRQFEHPYLLVNICNWPFSRETGCYDSKAYRSEKCLFIIIFFLYNSRWVRSKHSSSMLLVACIYAIMHSKTVFLYIQRTIPFLIGRKQWISDISACDVI